MIGSRKDSNVEKAKSFSILSRLFNKSIVINNQRKENCKVTSNGGDLNEKKADLVKNLDLELIYISRLLQQKIEALNRKNLILQLNHCSKLINERINEAELLISITDEDSFVPSDSLKSQLEVFNEYFKKFANWLSQMNEETMNEADRTVGLQLFIRLEFEARDFIGHLICKERLHQNPNFKRSSMDNSSFHSVKENKSRFSEEDRLLIEKLRELDKNIDIPPQKPSLPSNIDQNNLESYLNQIEELAKNQKQKDNNLVSVNQYYSDLDSRTINAVKVVDNCIMAASIYSDDIQAADEDADEVVNISNLQKNGSSTSSCTDDSDSFNAGSLSSSSSSSLTSLTGESKCNNNTEEGLKEEVTPTPTDMTTPFSFLRKMDANKAVSSKTVNESLRSSMPLPPIPGEHKTNRKVILSAIGGEFLSEGRYSLRERGIKARSQSRPSKVVSTPISNFNFISCSSGKSPLKSPDLVSSLDSRLNQRYSTSAFSNKRELINVDSPVSSRDLSASYLVNGVCQEFSQLQQPEQHPQQQSHHHHQQQQQLELTTTPLSPGRYQFMAEQIPAIVDNPSDLLDIDDMKNDIEIITANINNKSKRSSGISNLTTNSLPQSTVALPNQDELAQVDSEVKSDTEEYFEYLEIDGKKYRRKMQKRIVIEKIKIRKTIYAPMKIDGTGPDIDDMLDGDDSGDNVDEDVNYFDDAVDGSSKPINNEKDIGNGVIQQSIIVNGQQTYNSTSTSTSTSIRPDLLPQMLNFTDHQSNFKKCATMNATGNVDNETATNLKSHYVSQKSSTLTPSTKSDTVVPLLTNYMYQCGESDFEVPVIDERFSKHLSSASELFSSWMKTAESMLPQERSKSISFVRKFNERNESGNTVQSAVRVTTSRTVRLKTPKLNNVMDVPRIVEPEGEEEDAEEEDEEEEEEDEDKEEEVVEEKEDQNISDLFNSSTELTENDEVRKSNDNDNDNDNDGGSEKYFETLNKTMVAPIAEESLSNSTSTAEECGGGGVDSDEEGMSSKVKYRDEGNVIVTNVDADSSVPSSSTAENNGIALGRSRSSDSCFYSFYQNSYLADSKHQISFIIKEDNPKPYLIYDDNAKSMECEIAGGPVDALIAYACDGKEHMFLGAFLETYRTFIDSEDLINRLMVRYEHFRMLQLKESQQVEGSNNTNNTATVDNSADNVDKLDLSANSSRDSGLDQDNSHIRLRKRLKDSPEKKCKHVLSLLLTVIGRLKSDFTESVKLKIAAFQKFLEEYGEEQWSNAINKAISTHQTIIEGEKELVRLLLQYSNEGMTPVVTPDTETSPKLSVKEYTIFTFSSRSLAEQMTLLDWMKYREVELVDILNKKDITNCKFPGVLGYAEHFHKVQLWSQSMLLDPRNSDRDKICCKLLRIMKHLKTLKNFSSYIAILLGIQLIPIKLFSRRIRAKIKELDQYMKPPRFAGYKKDLREASSPCIPFLGLFYQDIVSLNNNNLPYINLEDLIQRNQKSNWTSNNFNILFSNMNQCGPIINFWRSFKQYLFLKNCNKDQDNIRYPIVPDRKILRFFGNFSNHFDEPTVHILMRQE